MHSTYERVRQSSQLRLILALTERKVFLNKPRVIHPRGDLTHEGKDLVPAALGTTREVLACEFGDPNRLVESVVEVGNVVDELLSISAVPVESNGVNLYYKTLSKPTI